MGGKASTASKNKWNAKAYDRINLTVPKGDKDRIREHAENFDNGSMAAFINRAIAETMVRDERRRENIKREISAQNPELDDITFELMAHEREQLQKATLMRLDSLHILKHKRAHAEKEKEE